MVVVPATALVGNTSRAEQPTDADREDATLWPRLRSRAVAGMVMFTVEMNAKPQAASFKIETVGYKAVSVHGTEPHRRDKSYMPSPNHGRCNWQPIPGYHRATASALAARACARSGWPAHRRRLPPSRLDPD